MKRGTRLAEVMPEVVAKYHVDDGGNLHGPRGIRKCREDKNGYFRFSARTSKGYLSEILVHQLVAYQKFGDEVYEHETVRHLDGNMKNNRPDNIAIGSFSDNFFDCTEDSRKKRAKHAASFLRGLTTAQLIQLKEDRLAGMKYDDLSAKYGIAKSTISYILNGKTYSDA